MEHLLKAKQENITGHLDILCHAPLVFFGSEVDYQRKYLSYLVGKAVVRLETHIESRKYYQQLLEANPAFLIVDLRFS